MTVPSSATDQSPDFEPLMACCTSLPSRGPAARALTVSRCETPYDAASGASAASSRTAFTFTSSATIDSKPASAAGSATTTVSDDERQPVAQAAGLAQRGRGRADLADLVHRGDQRVVGGQLVDASGQSARCTDRSPVSPRQTSSVVSGSSGAVTRQTVSSTV